MMSFVGNRILVPLDGSVAAEQAMLPAARIARAVGGTIVLVRIVPVRMWSAGLPGTFIPEEAYQRLLDDEDKVTSDYLSRMAYEVGKQGVGAETYSDRGDAAPSLLALERQLHIGLVVMTTHGRTGMARLTLGSVADYIVRNGNIPALLVRPFSPTSQGNALERVLVPLDGSRVAEAALEAVRQLAGVLVHHVTLLRAVNATENQSAHIEAQRYLEAQRIGLIERMDDREKCDITTVVVKGDAAPSILVQAGRACDFIIMATHGAKGIQRWAVGSVADGVLHDTPVPLLLVHP